jgi:hypothetical protein
MSSTNRTNAKERHASDYYVTPQQDIKLFFENWIKDECVNDGDDFIDMCRNLQDVIWLDPCAGGDPNHEMSYPSVIENYLGAQHIVTMDIREDSLADIKQDFLLLDSDEQYDIVITNPPFNQAQEIIVKAHEHTQENGFVIMLLRLNFLGSKQRKLFWEQYPPYRIYVHHKRMSFKDEGGTDSIEYAHFVWKKGAKPSEALLKII